MRKLFWAFILSGCVNNATAPFDLTGAMIGNNEYEIAYWQKSTNTTSPIHIYIEGDGYAFDGHGRPTDNPTPHGMLVRNMAVNDPAPNVAYIARPCQFIMSDACSVTDWTTGRFSEKIINEMSNVVRHIAAGRPIILIGYSGGAYVSAAIIVKNPDLNIHEWITIAGVLDHADWTGYFNDLPLSDSINLSELPHVRQRHYIAPGDSVVPNLLSRRWTGNKNLIVVPGATHNKFPNLDLDKS